ncbi:uncharacterized protein LOC132197053 [Neocloeon triangulifer]|uniref:uncharacterized protein LOC132197053 n=1 Tax=Neocloeon triangulifer TaxID=2078957 RepID=UPI00286F9AF8|nr:uncharacterized protein LOC132197053 [Neocloeon triangulifer]
MGQTEPGGRRGWAISAGILSTLQAGGYLGLAISALALYYCQIEAKFSTSDVGFLVYVTYFYNAECREKIGGDVIWPDQEFPTATLTWQWAVAFCAINGLWLFSSLFLTIAGAARGKSGFFRVAIPALWLISTAAVLVADVVASIMYGLDLGKVLNASEKPMLALLSFLDSGSQLAQLAATIEKSVAIIPSIALLIAVARGGILWVLNAIFFFGVLVSTIKSKRANRSAPKVLAQQPPEQPKRGDQFSHQQPRGVHNPAFEKHGEEDVYAISTKHRRARDPEIVAAEARAELRNQRPWSYLDPEPEELERVKRRPRTPPAEEWSFSPDSTLKLPRATLHPQPSAPHPSHHAYHYPYPDQAYANRYLDTTGRHNPYLK